MHATSAALYPWRYGVPRAQPRRGPQDVIRRGSRLPCLRKSLGRNLADAPHASVCVLPDVHTLAFRGLAAARWRPSRLYATNDEHAREAVEAASARDRIRASLPRALQVFSRGNGGVFLSSSPLRRAERAACKSCGARGELALVQPAAWGARRPGVSDSVSVAVAAPGGLAANRQRAAVGSGGEGIASVRDSRLPVRRDGLGCPDRQAVGTGIDASIARKAKRLRLAVGAGPHGVRFWVGGGPHGVRFCAYRPDLVPVTFTSHGGRDGAHISPPMGTQNAKARRLAPTLPLRRGRKTRKRAAWRPHSAPCGDRGSGGQGGTDERG